MKKLVILALFLTGCVTDRDAARVNLVQACQRENHTLAECLDAADRLLPVKECR